jgi:glucose-1-phosphate thymidylyltransferase
MHVIILAAGYGTRLQMTGELRPKALLQVGNAPIIEHQLELLKHHHCIDAVTLVTNAVYYEVFVEWFQTYKDTIPFKINIINDGSTSNETRVGPIKDIALGLNSIKCDEDLLILAGDNAFRIDISQIVSLRQKRDTNVLGVHTFKHKSILANKYGVVELYKNLRLKKFTEKPKNPLTKIAATAIYLIRKEDIPEIFELSNRPHDGELNLGELIKHFLKKKLPVYCMNIPTWFDIGTQKDLQIANDYYEQAQK